MKGKGRLILILCFLFVLATPLSVQAQGILSGKKIIIDAGHGGNDSGAVSKATGILEKDINMSLAVKIASYLKEMGANVIYTRQPGNDIYLELKERTDIANSSNADLFLSIHHDSNADTSLKGVSTHYSTYRPLIEVKDAYVKYNGGKYPYIKEEITSDGTRIYFQYGGRIISTSIENVIVYDPTPCDAAVKSEKLSQGVLNNLINLGFVNKGSKDHNLFVTRNVVMPSILVESGFMSNKDELLLVTSPSMEDKIAKGISESIKQYFISNGEVPVEPDIILPRYAGLDRYKTSIEISKAGWSTSETAIIACGEKFPDALSAGPLAKKYNAPVLLSEVNELRKDIESEINRLNVKTAYIVGGEGAVSKNIENKLSSKGINCIRIAGVDRYATSLEVAKRIGNKNGVFIASGEAFPDALSIASYAGFKGMPVILTDTNNLSQNAREFIQGSNAKAYVIGGSGVVSDKVLKDLSSVERIAGVDRYDTNIRVLDKFTSEYNLAKTYFSSGEVFADALSGSACAALTNSPIVLVSSSEYDLSNYTRSYVKRNAGAMAEKYVFGGTGIVPDRVITILFK